MRDLQTYSCLLISDFNLNNLAGYLDNDGDSPSVEGIVAPFGQLMPVLTQKNLECWQSHPDFALVWTQPDRISEAFKDLLNYKPASLETALEEVDAYSSLLLNVRDSVRAVFVPTWVFPSYHRGLGMLDLKTGIGISNTLMRMNLRLSENLGGASNIYLLDAQRWVNLAGKNAFNPKLWYLGKIAFGNEVFREAAKDLKSALRGIMGQSKKLVILDLDDTLWGGVVGEMGWEAIRLGGHDPIGEAYVDFQRALKSLTHRGILLGIVSKNEEAIGLEAISKHPEMVLRLEDFAGWKINWQDKAQNIVDLASELDLGLQSVVFIDDNPVERARVREALPEVLVPEWPEDKMLYKSALLSLRCFDTPSVSKEDLERTSMYVSQRQRQELKRSVGSFDEWLKGLRTRVKVEGLNEMNLQRTVQLLNKTNQMNLTTRRVIEPELVGWTMERNRKLWTFRVSDRFGDSGLTGVVTLEVKDKTGIIMDFVLSCRVMGRKIEETMLYTVIKYAQSIGLEEIQAKYIPTPKNAPCLKFFQRSGFASRNENMFTWDVREDYKAPEYVVIEEGA